MEHNPEASLPYLSYSIAFGVLAGAAVGLIFLDSTGFGAAIGFAFGITLGVSLEEKNTEDEEPL